MSRLAWVDHVALSVVVVGSGLFLLYALGSAWDRRQERIRRATRDRAEATAIARARLKKLEDQPEEWERTWPTRQPDWTH